MDFVAFYRGQAADHLGRMLDDILRWSDHKLEASHNYIQILFPLLEASQHIPNAPVLDAAALAEFRTDPIIQKNLRRSFEMMLRFYGFTSDKGAIVPAVHFQAK